MFVFWLEVLFYFLLTCMPLRGNYKGDRMNSEKIRIRHAI